MHIYTGIQILCLIGLWAIKESPGALSLPLMIILLIPFRRFILPFWFKSEELDAVSRSYSKRFLFYVSGLLQMCRVSAIDIN